MSNGGVGAVIIVVFVVAGVVVVLITVAGGVVVAVDAEDGAPLAFRNGRFERRIQPHFVLVKAHPRWCGQVKRGGPAAEVRVRKAVHSRAPLCCVKSRIVT
jgi:hypothetical protein